MDLKVAFVILVSSILMGARHDEAKTSPAYPWRIWNKVSDKYRENLDERRVHTRGLGI